MPRNATALGQRSELLMRVGLPVVTAALVLAWCGGPAQAAPGDLDPTFGNGGKVSFAPAGTQGSFDDVAIQPDGKIVVVGTAINGGDSDFDITRLNADGSPDQGFGTGGTTLVNIRDAGGRSNDGASAVALQPDGKIVAAGFTYDPGSSFAKVVLVRLTTSGALDPGFQDQGSGLPGAVEPRAGVAQDVAVQPDGKIVYAGYWDTFRDGKGDFFVGRQNGDGNGDDTFSTGASDTLDFGGNDVARGLALQPDGRIVLAGHTDAAGNTDVAVARYIPGTGFDNGVGSGGKLTFGYGSGASDGGASVVVQPDGKIDVAGFGSAQQDFALTRVTSSGALDPSLNGANTVSADFGGEDEAAGLALEANGKMLLAGYGGATSSSFALARFQPGGALDDTFGQGGKITVSFAGADSDATALALQSDGRIVVVGETTNGPVSTPAAARLLGDAPSAGGTPAPAPGTGSAGPGTPGTTGAGGSPSASVPRCGGKVATIVGTSGNDKLKGTKAADVIAGLAGNDRISGVGGNDVICGGTGNDRLSGGSGKDRLFGDNGQDVLSGGASNDTLAGGAGRDSLNGGAGRDRLNGNAGKDKLNGGPGKDRCTGTRSDKKNSC